MRIITVNVPVEMVKLIELHIENYKLYQSRSELVRVAVREFLLRELGKLDDLRGEVGVIHVEGEILQSESYTRDEVESPREKKFLDLVIPGS
ncbi:MAG: ribbon-helix-helix domain-containing protein [Promethearchaeota archaeon]